MTSKDILYQKGKNDECYTPRETVLALLPYIKQYKDKIIWLPFDTKDSNFVKRAMSFNKPFALLMNIVWLNDKAPKEVFKNEIQLFLLKDRVNFISPDGKPMGKPTFASAFFCRNFLPKDICLEGY